GFGAGLDRLYSSRRLGLGVANQNDPGGVVAPGLAKILSHRPRNVRVRRELGGAFIDVSAMALQDFRDEWQELRIMATPVVLVERRRFRAIEQDRPAMQAEWHRQLLEAAEHSGINGLRHRIYCDDAQWPSIEEGLRPTREIDTAEQKIEIDRDFGFQERPVLSADAELDI